MKNMNVSVVELPGRRVLSELLFLAASTALALSDTTSSIRWRAHDAFSSLKGLLEFLDFFFLRQF